MKYLIATLALVMSCMASAESAKFSFKGFNGEFKLKQEDIKITSVTMNAKLQHCNFWGTTCAGGRNENKSTELTFKQDESTKLLTFKAPETKLSSSFFGQKFSSCNLSLTVKGLNQKGQRYEGDVTVIFKNDKSYCGSSSAVNEAISEYFKVPAELEMTPKYFGL